MKKQWLLICGFAMGLWAVGSRTHAETTSDKPDDTEERQLTIEELTIIHERGVKLIRLLDHGRFVLAGEVVDRDGKPLADISLRVGMTQMNGWGWDASKESDSTIRNEVLKAGAFRIDASPYFSVSLQFEKEGYYPEKLYYRFDYEPEGEQEREERVRAGQRIMRGEEVTVKEGVVRHENIRVVMEKMGEVMKPVVYGGPLQYAPGYGGSTAQIVYIDFTIPPQKDYKLKKIANVGELTNMPTAAAYAIAETDEEGRVAHEMIKLGTFRPEAYARKIYVRINDPEGGFVEYVPKDKEFAFWTMKTAPESGYVREIGIDPEKVIKRIRSHQMGVGGIYFYFKVGGRYGKGRIGGIEVLNGGERARIYIGFRVQPDGSRNVDTGREPQ